ncbi:amino acid adenylation domain-containing protein [Pseudomonas sp. CCM 7891]|uniref:Amino acid adenylation domain-containing protein n=1 Tax=Pseudomonas karstica TaxID=1055468 RepID=A0A7X2RR06_9PSED|nr:non-ribosomal peptide synthetase [Pseudomonas karstica]MTD19384.1 amino acid adenylation domain-containing protein [Pseudomonas karstica]
MAQATPASSTEHVLYPLTAPQLDIWLDQVLHGDSPLYNIGGYARINGPVDASRLQQAINQVAGRYDALRIQLVPGSPDHPLPRQRFLGSVSTPLVLHDVSAHDDPQASALALLQEKLQTPFSFESGLLLRTDLLKVRQDLYYFFVNCHHLIIDGWSFAMIGRAFSQAYTALHDQTESEVTAPTYQAYIEQQSTAKDSAAFQRQRQYWLDKYRTLPQPLLAPRHQDRWEPRLTPSQNHAWRLPRALYNRLGEQAKASGQGTVFHVMLAVLYSYFARAEQRDEIVIGLPILNRANAAHKATMGLFVGMSPVRLSLGTDLRFGELVGKIAVTLKQDYRYQRFPLSELNRELGLQNLDRRQLFDLVVSYEQDQDTWYGPAPAQPVKLSNGYEQMPLAMHIRESAPDDDVWMHFIYNEAYFEETQIATLQQRFMNIVQCVADDFDVPVNTLDLMPPTERLVLRERNRTEVDYPRDVLLHQLIEAQAAARPEAIAVRFEDQALTYDQLNRQANQLAHTLLETGLDPDARVAICVERSLEMVVGLLGILKAGAAYVPLDPGYPADRLSHMLSDSAPSALITTRGLLTHLPAVTMPVLCLDTDHERLRQQPEHNPNATALGLTPQHLAYVIYTSGSTGLPKGVMNQHDGVVNRLLWARDAYGVDEHSRVLQKTPFSFDVSVWEFFLPLLSGAQLVIAAPDGHKNPRYLMDIMASAGITLLHFVPSMLQVFLDEVEPQRLPALKQVLCSGEALPHALQKRFFEHLPRVQLHNLYGPTEAAIDVTAWHCRPDLHEGIVPIGQPIANIQMHILDANLQLLPPGVVGELHIGGIGVARGYLNRPELTAERFIDDPFQASPQARLYKTGDLGRWLPDGSIEYLGRNDFQVKIRGLRIELGEIEARLLACKGVKDVVVIARQEAEGDAYLSAYLVSEPGCVLSPQALREALHQQVPDYMIPRHLIQLEQFPLNVNGKLDRKALPEPMQTSGSTDATAPRTALEQALAELWQDNLKRTALGVHDNYFMLGGDSMKVIHLQIKAREQGIALTLAQIYQHPTIAQLAQRLQTQDASPTGLQPLAHMAPFAQVPQEIRLASAGLFDDVFAASQLQVGMIYHSMMHPDSAIYHDIFRYRLRLRWDAVAWDRACSTLIRRHPALRMSFDIGHAEVPMARVHSRVESPVKVIDVVSLSPEARTQAISTYVEERKRYREDWHQAPLYQFCVFVAADEIDLVFSFHHAILDGWSVATLMRDLITLYTATPGADALPVLTTTPADFVALEQEAITADTHRQFWSEYLRDAPAASMTSWVHVVAPDPTPHRSAYREIPAVDLARLEAFCRARDLPLRAVLLTAHGFAQAIMSNQKEVLCGVISHGRPEFEDAASVLGLFLNTLPVRFSTQGQSWLEVVRASIAQEQQVFAHRRYPFALIHRETDVDLNVVFNYVDFYVLKDMVAQGEEVLTDWETTEASNYDLLTTIGRHPGNGSLMLKMDYRTARVATSQVDAYADYLLRTLELMMAAPDAKPCIPAWSPTFEQATPTSAAALPHGNLSSLLLDSFVRHDERTAVGLDQARLSYRQLSNASAQLVSWLHQHGIGQGDRVAIMMPRSPDLIIALLGVIQAGAAYVPIDLSYPDDRIRLILEDSQPCLVLFADASANLATTLAGEADKRHWDSVVAGFDGNLAHSHDLVASIATNIEGEDNAYVLYTSGSTGRPKGVAMPHRALTNMILWQNRRQAQDACPAESLKTLQYSPISFDVSFQEILSTLSCGAELVMIDEALRYDFIRLLKFICAQEVNRLFLPYVAFQGLAEVAMQLGIRPVSLRQVNVAGEQLKITGEIRGLIDGLDDCRVENHYGPTEAHVVTSLKLEGATATWPSMPPIGRPIDGVRMHVLDAAGNACPVGVMGDLFIEGACLANGYWSRPDLTDERFIYRQLEGETRRLYETGDIGFYLPWGDLVYQGRSDAQVKIRGYRIELGEIEVAIHGSARFGADIQQVAVIDKPASDGSRYLVGFIQAMPGRTPDLDQLKAEMRLALPDYMVPNTLVSIAQLPLGPTGKIDRQRLQKVEVQNTLLRAFTAPRNAREDLLQAYWQETLGLEDISVHDNFFELGGNSLKAVQLVAMLARHQGLEPSLSDFIQAPTIAEFAQVLQQTETGHPDTGALVDFKNATGKPTLFLVHPIGGHVLCYAALARVLKHQVHLYALQAPGTWDAREPLQSVQTQAVYYADAIEQVAPEGPLNIGGWSYGGVVAYELASELQRRGRSLHNVFLLDTIVRVRQGEVQIERTEFMNWFMWELLSGDGQKEYDYQALDFSSMSDSHAFEAIRQHGIDQGMFDETITLATLDQLFRVFHANWQGLLDYRFPPLDLPITLFAADVELPDVLQAPHELVGTAFRDPYRGWRSIAPQVQRVAVEGDHLTMMREPHIEGVGEFIKLRIDATRARSAGSRAALA